MNVTLGRIGHTFARFVCLLFFVSLAGCGSENDATAIVQGTVTLDGELAKAGSIVFHSQTDKPTAYATIGNDGSFTMRVGRGNAKNMDRSKIYAGDYVAAVSVSGPPLENEEHEGAPPRPGPRLSAAKYSSKVSSDLSYSVKAGMNVINIELESPSPEEIAAMSEAAATEESAAIEAASTDKDTPEEDPQSEAGDVEGIGSAAEPEQESD